MRRWMAVRLRGWANRLDRPSVDRSVAEYVAGVVRSYERFEPFRDVGKAFHRIHFPESMLSADEWLGPVQAGLIEGMREHTRRNAPKE